MNRVSWTCGFWGHCVHLHQARERRMTKRRGILGLEGADSTSTCVSLPRTWLIVSKQRERSGEYGLWGKQLPSHKCVLWKGDHTYLVWSASSAKVVQKYQWLSQRILGWCTDQWLRSQRLLSSHPNIQLKGLHRRVTGLQPVGLCCT